MSDKPERISMRVASWSTNEPQPDGWCLNLVDQAVTCKVGGLVFSYGIEEGLRQYTSAISADLATPAPREDGYSAGVRAAIEAEALAIIENMDLMATGMSRIGSTSTRAQRILALLDGPALPDARAGAVDPVALTEEDRADIIQAAYVAYGKHRRGIRGQIVTEWDGIESWVVAETAKRLSRATPACTATDGPASACAPGLGTAATFEKG